MNRGLLALLLVVVAGCATPRGLFLRAAEHQTRLMRVYDGFSTTLILRGTLLTSEYRATMAEERRRLLDASAEDHAGFVERMAQDDADYLEVVFSADSPQPEGDRFGDSDDGWILRLEADGVDQPLVTAYRVRRPTPLHRALYPHLNIWSELWIARFERTVADPEEVVLKVGSGYGHGELTWTGLRSGETRRADAGQL